MLANSAYRTTAGTGLAIAYSQQAKKGMKSVTRKLGYKIFELSVTVVGAGLVMDTTNMLVNQSII